MVSPYSHFSFEPTELSVFFAAEQIYRDYQEFLKNAVMPIISERYDIRIRELLTLVCIDSAAHPVSAADVATIMRQDPATLSRSTVILIGKNLVSTSRSVHDSRIKILNVTETGQKVANDFKSLMTGGLESIRRSAMMSFSVNTLESVEAEGIIPFQKRAMYLAEASASRAFKISNDETSTG